jgi:small nuclear ribonucleoprotein (snRNP)-like protein
MKMEVGRDTRVSVKLRNDNTVVGYLAAVSDRSFLVTDPETHVSTQVPYRNVKQIDAMSKGAKDVMTATFAMVGILLWVVCGDQLCL